MLLACLLAFLLAALVWVILSFAAAATTICFVSMAGSRNVHARELLGVLLVLTMLTVLIFWDAWREQLLNEPEEDHAHGVGAGRALVRARTGRRIKPGE
jgi:hypothetical protein